MRTLASHLAQLPRIDTMLPFPTVEALQEAYAQHLLAMGTGTDLDDARWSARNDTKYDPLFTKRGSYINTYGYSTERDERLAACEAHRVKRYTDQGLPVPPYRN